MVISLETESDSVVVVRGDAVGVVRFDCVRVCVMVCVSVDVIVVSDDGVGPDMVKDTSVWVFGAVGDDVFDVDAVTSGEGGDKLNVGDPADDKEPTDEDGEVVNDADPAVRDDASVGDTELDGCGEALEVGVPCWLVLDAW